MVIKGSQEFPHLKIFISPPNIFVLSSSFHATQPPVLCGAIHSACVCVCVCACRLDYPLSLFITTLSLSHPSGSYQPPHRTLSSALPPCSLSLRRVATLASASRGKEPTKGSRRRTRGFFFLKAHNLRVALQLSPVDLIVFCSAGLRSSITHTGRHRSESD